MSEATGNRRHERHRQPRRDRPRRRADAGEPLVRPHARLPLRRPGQRLPVRPAVRGADRVRAEPGRQRRRGRRSTRSPRPPRTPTSCPGADPGEGYKATNSQLYGSTAAPAAGTAGHRCGASSPTTRTRSAGRRRTPAGTVLPGTTASDDHGLLHPGRPCRCCRPWRPGTRCATTGSPRCRPRRMPNRAFTCAGTSQGQVDDKTKTFTAPSIFGALGHRRGDLGDLRLQPDAR